MSLNETKSFGALLEALECPNSLYYVVAAVTTAYLGFWQLSKKESQIKRSQEYQGDGTLTESLKYFALFFFSHFICYYLWWTAEYYKGELQNPLDMISPDVIDAILPNKPSICLYFGFISLQLLFAAVLPGVTVTGFSIPSEGNRRLRYKCNALAAWYCTIFISVVLHKTGVLDFKTIYSQSGPLLTTAILVADTLAVFMYLECLRTNRCSFSLSTFAHDFVMGQYLNPRIGAIDMKMWAEVRVSWMLLYALDISAALCLQEKIGYIPYRMWIVLLIHGLYTNACMKGEESIPFTWDIFHERWGWMLIYWNLAGVAFAYTFNGRFLVEQGGDLKDVSLPVFLLMAAGVVAAYWVFDESQAQKNRFRAQAVSGGYVKRLFGFPQLPNSTLKSPKYLETKAGSKLLVDGWWKYARKPHYTADLCLAALLSLTGGFGHALPYFFISFFFPMLIHRAYRDNRRCEAKYGQDWDRYKTLVPFTFLPGFY